MSQRSLAEEHLRVIRSLMEKATIYRTISAPAALIGGLLGVLGAAFLHFIFSTPRAADETSCWFLCTWLGVLALAAVSNTAFLHRAARHRGELFLSPGMRLALVAMAPGLLCAAFFTFIFGGGFALHWLPAIWMLCYGMALLATSHFAPRSILILGWCFLASGLTSVYLLVVAAAEGRGYLHGMSGSNILMGLTFGVYHLIYAACTWPRDSAEATTLAAD
jgi:hypothetical protein